MEVFMQRWHRERSLMLRRWKMEMRLHGYDWRNPPDPKCDRKACHCAAGIGSMRWSKPFDCGNPRCGSCHWGKFYEPKARLTKKQQAIQFELDAYGL